MSRTLSVSVVALVAVAAVLTHGCGRSKAVLAPKPAMYATESAAKNQMVDNMRAWLETLGPQEAKTLEKTGQVAFTYDGLKASDPEHAKMVDNYVKSLAATMRAKMQARGFPVPILTVQNVIFVRHARDARGQPAHGAYEFGIQFADGSIANLPLSDPL
jgi:hypothetical protein